MRSLLMLKLFTCMLSLVFVASAVSQTAPPVARVDNITDEYFGVKVTDPYRWMEDLKSDETRKWMRAQAEYADLYLQNLPLHKGSLKRLREVSAAGVQPSQIRRHGNYFFYLRR